MSLLVKLVHYLLAVIEDNVWFCEYTRVIYLLFSRLRGLKREVYLRVLQRGREYELKYVRYPLQVVLGKRGRNAAKQADKILLK